MRREAVSDPYGSGRGRNLRRLLERLSLAAATLGLVVCTAAAAAAPAHRIVAVGDLHGDFIAWRAIAEAAKLVDKRGRWSGGDTVFVQTGDVVDRGPDSLKIIQDLMRLQREAARAHGQVIALVGNHEAMNVTGDFRYVSAGDYAAYATPRSAQVREATYEANKATLETAYHQKDPAMAPEAIKQAWLDATPPGYLEHQVAWSPTGPIGRWIEGNPAVALVGGALFLHGGISPAYVTVPVDEINRRVAASLTAGDTDKTAIINDEDGPLWYRGLAVDPAQADASPAVAAQVDQVLAAYGAQHIVIGHTPILSGIAVLYGGKLARIDTGISAVFKGKLSWLEIIDGKLQAHEVERPKEDQGGR
jgi:hypothetical protein